MNLFEEINKKRLSLLPTKTTVLHADGRVFLEEIKNGIECRTQVASGKHGYVVDTKPDLQVAKIIPGLFLGSQDPAKDEELLSSYGISHVLSIGVQVEYPKTSKLSYTFVPAFDIPEFDITSIFELCFALIDSILEVNSSIFVHCNAGVSRSPIVIIGYLIKQHGFTFEDAFKLVKDVRPSVSPNPGFIEQLKTYEKWLNNL